MPPHLNFNMGHFSSVSLVTQIQISVLLRNESLTVGLFDNAVIYSELQSSSAYEWAVTLLLPERPKSCLKIRGKKISTFCCAQIHPLVEFSKPKV